MFKTAWKAINFIDSMSLQLKNLNDNKIFEIRK